MGYVKGLVVLNVLLRTSQVCTDKSQRGEALPADRGDWQADEAVLDCRSLRAVSRAFSILSDFSLARHVSQRSQRASQRSQKGQSNSPAVWALRAQAGTHACTLRSLHSYVVAAAS